MVLVGSIPDAQLIIAPKKKFTELTDTPANYTDEAGKYVKVNAGEDGLEFVEVSGEITNLDGGKSDSNYTVIDMSPIDGGDST